MDEFSAYILVLGIFLISTVIYHILEESVWFFNDDKFWAKKSSNQVLQERIKMNEDGKLNKFYQFDLYYRIFMNKKKNRILLLLFGVILFCIGLILNILF